jgi:hypothetical protein
MHFGKIRVRDRITRACALIRLTYPFAERSTEKAARKDVIQSESAGTHTEGMSYGGRCMRMLHDIHAGLEC